MRHRLTPVLPFAVVLVCAALAHGAPAGSFSARGTVTRVVDGDTLHVRLDSGRTEKVRLIGIDTPELGRCLAGRATRVARDLSERRRVMLRGDSTQATRDRYGRLLAYAWIRGERDLGYQLLQRGLARVYVYDQPFARLSAYRAAEAAGHRASPSIWRNCAAPAPAPVAGGRCDPSYPGVCIPPPPPDLDCKDVPHTGFTVVGADPHRFDGDGDGVGCEG
jgi:endonuclease YncB( thermonuclease family)